MCSYKQAWSKPVNKLQQCCYFDKLLQAYIVAESSPGGSGKDVVVGSAIASSVCSSVDLHSSSGSTWTTTGLLSQSTFSLWKFIIKNTLTYTRFMECYSKRQYTLYSFTCITDIKISHCKSPHRLLALLLGHELSTFPTEITFVKEHQWIPFSFSLTFNLQNSQKWIKTYHTIGQNRHFSIIKCTCSCW